MIDPGVRKRAVVEVYYELADYNLTVFLGDKREEYMSKYPDTEIGLLDAYDDLIESLGKTMNYG